MPENELRAPCCSETGVGLILPAVTRKTLERLRAPAGYVRPVLFQGEWDAGYFGRLARFHGCGSPPKALELSYQLVKPWPPTSACMVARLALIAGVELEHMVRDHGLLGLELVCCPRTEDIRRLPSNQSRTGTQLYGLVGTRRPRLCRECIQRDLGEIGTSLWRRDHQLPGQLWCAEHQTPLFSCDGPTSCLAAPSSLLNQVTPLPAECMKAAAHPNVRWFLAWQKARINLGKAVEPWRLSKDARRDGDLQTFRAFTYELRYQVRARLAEGYPRAWLDQVMPLGTLRNPIALYRMSKQDRQLVISLLLFAREDLLYRAKPFRKLVLGDAESEDEPWLPGLV